ncbi:F-box domain-containing protein [Mycena chlorophos]|uniref:F-box domain-containing protein n=1 Tax=Mycena chlorophos TaxID=658473 RepID=A0A8H6WHY3_MYCCL|nr:F-box domain-containing protein [Mycena chlorophos]
MSFTATYCSKCRADLFQSSPFLPTATQTAELDALLRSNHAAAAGFGAPMLDDDTAQSELSRYAKEIEEVQAYLETLVHERARLATHVERARSVRLCHIRRLPPEILAEILEYCVPSLEEYQMTSLFLSTETERLAKVPLLMLAKVSARWRQIVMSSPQFWSTIVLNFEAWPDADWGRSRIEFQRHLDLVSTSLARSANHDLVIAFVGSWYDDGSMREAFQLLLEHASSWVELHMDACLSPDSFASAQFPALRTLRMSMGSEDEFDFSFLAPTLRVLSFQGYLDFLPSVSWDRIQMFDYSPLGGVTWNHTQQDLLPWGLFRRETTFNFTVQYYDATVDSAVALHSDLGTLLLRLAPNQATDAPRILSGIFGNLTLPNLHRLYVLNHEANYWTAQQRHWLYWDEPQFSQLAARSQFAQNLRCLAIGAKITPSELFSALELLVALEVLRLTDVPENEITVHLITTLLLQALSSPSLQSATNTARLVPNLRLLELITRGLFTEEALLQFLESRISLRAALPESDKLFRLELRYVVNAAQDAPFRGGSAEFWGRVQHWERQHVLCMEFDGYWKAVGWRPGNEKSWRE